MNLIYSTLKKLKETQEEWSDKFWGMAMRPTFIGDGMMTFRKSVGFMKEGRLAEAIKLNASRPIQYRRAWRLHTLCWAAVEAKKLNADFVECGVFNGYFSSVVAHTLEFEKLNATFWLYDTFEGFCDKYTSMDDFGKGKIFYNVAMTDYTQVGLYESVIKRFEKYPNVKIIKGPLPDSLSQGEPDKIGYLHVDLNSPKAEVLTLEALFPKVVPGGFVIFDDYGWKDFVKQKIAIDEFMAARGLTVLELPTGQGLVVKPPQT